MLNVEQLRKKFQEIRARISKEDLNNWLDKAEEREKLETLQKLANGNISLKTKLTLFDNILIAKK